MDNFRIYKLEVANGQGSCRIITLRYVTLRYPQALPFLPGIFSELS